MENFTFYLPTRILFGKGQISSLAACIKPFGDKILLVYGKDSIKKNGIYQEVVAQLSAAGISYVELSGVDPNPRIATVREGARICRQNNVKLVLGVGGGSVIDCSKGIAVAAGYEGEAWDIWARKYAPRTALPVGAVLTLAATASEANRNAVICNPETLEKKGFGDEILLPKFAIMDPSYTFTVPKKHTAAAIADTLAHIFEYYFMDIPGAMLQDEFCEGVLRTVVQCAGIVM
ncbi:MAG: iron-containing alcohol dehydrogenase, partial [Spirochaetaceae bacterium]